MTTSQGECKPPARHAANSDMAPNEVPPGDTAAGDGLHGITKRAGAVTGPPDEIQELRQEIEQTREGLGKTVLQLAATGSKPGETAYCAPASAAAATCH